MSAASKCPIKRLPRKRKCKCRVDMVAWSRVNCNGSIHVIGLNTNGHLVFKNHKIHDLKRALKLSAAGGGETSACTCATFYRYWVLGERNAFMLEGPLFALTRERLAWNNGYEEQKADTGVVKRTVRRPKAAELLAHRILYRMRRKHGIRGIEATPPRTGTIKSAKHKSEGVNEAGRADILDQAIKRLETAGIAKKHTDKCDTEFKQYGQGEVYRPVVPLLRLQDETIFLALPVIPGVRARRYQDDKTLNPTVWVDIGRLRTIATTHPHVRVYVWKVDGDRPDMTVTASHKDAWDLRYLTDMLAGVIFEKIIEDRESFYQKRRNAELSAIFDRIERLPGLGGARISEEPKGRASLEMSISVNHLTPYGAAQMARTLTALKGRYVDVIEKLAKQRAKKKNRFPGDFGTCVSVCSPDKYDPADKLE